MRESGGRDAYGKLEAFELTYDLGAGGKEGHRFSAQIAQVEFLCRGVHGVSATAESCGF